MGATFDTLKPHGTPGRERERLELITNIKVSPVFYRERGILHNISESKIQRFYVKYGQSHKTILQRAIIGINQFLHYLPDKKGLFTSYIDDLQFSSPLKSRNL